MELRERIAFELWNETNPAPWRDSIRIDNLGQLVTKLGGGWTGSVDLALDWKLNRSTFLERADIALAALDAYDEAEFQKSAVS